ncbi:MAG: polymerase subunit gamma/tau [Actinomycetota bacterium]|nr:polymerase subunit gamma/tau [Actinomycetota bacterium]
MPQALYRRYRPETFADVIGQDHVTEPLQQALRHDRIHHAYLFSGPRGCGKTTSARILARCLNCEQGPTPTPCGVCDSCQALARNGAGSLDVIEIDAASHGGVDDARELRERAFYAPASSRFKVYIIDEAHMVSREGFNALLKLVEEPPEHVKFVFATTEPDKVIATIRSRTHHYPFRLVPPGELSTYLAKVCEQEGVTVETGVLSLVVRAGRGSVRDSMSVLDQLVAGAAEDGLSYSGAIALLGYTDATLLDDTIEAFAAGDGAAAFQIVDRVLEGGHDPRRFAEDLLERLRDLIIIDAVPDAAGNILGEHPADELDRMRQQAAHIGAAELSRAADIVNTGLTEMRGATAPRLQLELICARVLLPAAEHGARGLAARLDRVERRMSITGTTGPAASPAATDPQAAASSTPAPAPATGARGAGPGSPEQPPRPAPSSAAAELSAPAPQTSRPAVAAPEGQAEPAPTTVPAEAAAAESSAAAAAVESSAAASAGPDGPAPVGDDTTLDLTTVRRMWPDVLEAVKGMRRFTWTLLSHNAQVAAVGGGRLTLTMVNAGARDSFTGGGSDEILREALIQVLGVDWKVEAIIDPSTTPSGASAPPAAAPAGRTAARGSAASAAAAGRAAGEPSPGLADDARTGPSPAEDDAAPSADDPDADDTAVTHQDLLARELGAKVIGEYDSH